LFDYNQIMSLAFVGFGLVCLFRGKGTVPNTGLILLAAAMPVAGLSSGMDVATIAIHLLSGVAGLVVCLLGFAFLFKRGGFWKTIAVLALWLPLPHILPVIGAFCVLWFIPLLIDTLAARARPGGQPVLAPHRTAILLIVAGLAVSPTLALPLLYKSGFAG
jgi:Flp pilus assembly protein protease CpaA